MNLLWYLWPIGNLHDSWAQIFPNIVASIWVGIALWLWKIGPHLREQKRHREDVVRQLQHIHEKIDNDAKESGGPVHRQE